jgi:hypothetical protein
MVLACRPIHHQGSPCAIPVPNCSARKPSAKQKTLLREIDAHFVEWRQPAIMAPACRPTPHQGSPGAIPVPNCTAGKPSAKPKTWIRETDADFPMAPARNYGTDLPANPPSGEPRRDSGTRYQWFRFHMKTTDKNYNLYSEALFPNEGHG